MAISSLEEISEVDMRENLLLFVVIILQVLAIMLQLCVYGRYKKLKKESEKMQTTTNETLKQMKLKYENYRKLDVFIPNVEAFINRYLDGEKIFLIEMTAISKFIYILQFAVALLGVGQTIFSIRKGIVIGFSMIMFYCVCKVVDYIEAEKQAAMNIRSFFAKLDHGRAKDRREDKQREQIDTENKQTSASEHLQSGENPDISGDISISEAAVYDMLSELFDL